jgi:hypothetical protein
MAAKGTLWPLRVLLCFIGAVLGGFGGLELGGVIAGLAQADVHHHGWAAGTMQGMGVLFICLIGFAIVGIFLGLLGPAVCRRSREWLGFGVGAVGGVGAAMAVAVMGNLLVKRVKALAASDVEDRLFLFCLASMACAGLGPLFGFWLVKVWPKCVPPEADQANEK